MYLAMITVIESELSNGVYEAVMKIIEDDVFRLDGLDDPDLTLETLNQRYIEFMELAIKIQMFYHELILNKIVQIDLIMKDLDATKPNRLARYRQAVNIPAILQSASTLEPLTVAATVDKDLDIVIVELTHMLGFGTDISWNALSGMSIPVTSSVSVH